MPRSKKAERNSKPAFEEGSGNVFIDLGFPEHQAINIVARLKLMMQIESIIKQQRWTPEEAAKLLGIRPPGVSELMSSRWEKFTVDVLMKLLDRLGREVEFTVKAKSKVA